MKQTLGKLFFILISTQIIFAEVLTKVEPQAVYKGDATNFVIMAEGDNIEFPTISEINGVPVEGTSRSESISIVNMHQTRSISQSYRFRPTKSMTIAPLSFKIDGKVVKTQAVKVEVVKPTASKNGEPFVVEIGADKTTAYVGEPIDISVKLKYKMNAGVKKVQLGEPKLENFWVKKVDKIDQSREGDYIVETGHYQFFPQKSGSFELPAIEALIGQVDRRQQRGAFNDPFFGGSLFGQQLRWRKIYSNALKLTVNALPNGVELYGDFHINATVDKQKVIANKPVNLSISVEGEGNIDDVKKFELNLPNAIVYADEPKVTSHQKHNIFSQKIALIGDQNFTIPALSLKFFDKTTQKVKTISTKPIEIEVTGGKKGLMSPAKIEMSPSNKVAITPSKKEEKASSPTSQTVVVQEQSYVKYLFLLLGFLLGLGAMYGFLTLKNKEQKQERDIVKAIHKAKDDRALFELLLPHSKSSKVVADALNLLEENLYKGAKHTIDRELLMAFFEEES